MTDPRPHRSPEGETCFGQSGLTGFWTGVFDAADASFDATPFHAFLHEEDGRVGGETVEPNTLSPERIEELFASLEGWREGEEIEFVKTYEDALGAGHAVRFEGAVDPSEGKIEGVWTMLGPKGRSGPFVMNKRENAPQEHIAQSGAQRPR